MPADGGLYSDQTALLQKIQLEDVKVTEADTLWEPNRLEVLKGEPIEKPEYQQDLDKAIESIAEKQYDFKNTTKTWADYMMTRYHPRSINLLPALGKTKDVAFDCYPMGNQLWTESYFNEEFGDRIRQVIPIHNVNFMFFSVFAISFGKKSTFFIFFST